MLTVFDHLHEGPDGAGGRQARLHSLVLGCHGLQRLCRTLLALPASRTKQPHLHTGLERILLVCFQLMTRLNASVSAPIASGFGPNTGCATPEQSSSACSRLCHAMALHSWLP